MRTPPLSALLAVLALAILAAQIVYAQSEQRLPGNGTRVDEVALRTMYNHELDRSVVVVLHGSEYGTGWFVAPYRDVVVTAAHVVGYDPHASVVAVHGEWRAAGRVIYLDRVHDVAVIKLGEPWGNAKPLPLCTDVPKGETLLVIGYPYELLRVTGSIERMSVEPRAAFGIVTWVDKERGIFEFQATTDQGNSGGPIVDVDSECVLGLVSFALRGTVGVTYFGTMSKYIRAALEKTGLQPLEKTPTSAEAPSLSLPSNERTRLYAVVAAAGVGGLLIGALLFGGRRWLALLLPLALLPILAAATAHAEIPVRVEYLGSVTVSGALPPASNITAGEIIVVRFEGKLLINNTLVYARGWAWCEAYGWCTVYNETMLSTGNVSVEGWVRYDVYRLVGERSPPPGHVYLWTFRVRDGDKQIHTFTRSLPSNPGGWCIWANTARKPLPGHEGDIIWSISGWYVNVKLPDGSTLAWSASRWPAPATHHTRVGGTVRVEVRPYGLPVAETIVTVAVYKPHYASNMKPPYWTCCWPWTCNLAECQGSAACSQNPTTTTTRKPPTTTTYKPPSPPKPTTTTTKPTATSNPPPPTPTATPPATTSTTGLEYGTSSPPALAAAAALAAIAALAFLASRR